MPFATIFKLSTQYFVLWDLLKQLCSNEQWTVLFGGGGYHPLRLLSVFSGMPCLAGEVAAVVLVIWHVPEYRSHEISRTLHFKEIRSVFPTC